VELRNPPKFNGVGEVNGLLSNMEDVVELEKEQRNGCPHLSYMSFNMSLLFFPSLQNSITLVLVKMWGGTSIAHL